MLRVKGITELVALRGNEANRLYQEHLEKRLYNKWCNSSWQRCYNCFEKGHITRECISKEHTCTRCGQRHHVNAHDILSKQIKWILLGSNDTLKDLQTWDGEW